MLICARCYKLYTLLLRCVDCHAKIKVGHIRNRTHFPVYYAGFSGPYLLEEQTMLYVSLRCMQLNANMATLYAGGGIMPESKENEEWEETVRKWRP